MLGFMTGPRRYWHGPAWMAGPGARPVPGHGPPRGSSALQGADQRVGETEEQGDGQADDERRVDQAGEQEHTALQHRDQLRLAGGRLEELGTHDRDAEAGAERAEADDDADREGGQTLNVGDELHGASPG